MFKNGLIALALMVWTLIFCFFFGWTKNFLAVTALISILAGSVSPRVWNQYKSVLEQLLIPILTLPMFPALLYHGFSHRGGSISFYWAGSIAGILCFVIGLIFLQNAIEGNLPHVFGFRREFGKFPPAEKDRQGRIRMAPMVLTEIKARIVKFRESCQSEERLVRLHGPDHPESVEAKRLKQVAKDSMWEARNVAWWNSFNPPVRQHEIMECDVLDVA